MKIIRLFPILLAFMLTSCSAHGEHGEVKPKPDDQQTVATFNVSFDANGGTGSMSVVQVTQFGTYTLPDCGFTAPNDKEFDYWNVNGTSKQPGDVININMDTVVIASWKSIVVTTYTITFDSNGGSGSMAAVTVNENEQYTLPACGFTAPSKKQFKAWQIGSDATERAVGYSFTVESNLTIKAIWESIPVNQFTVSFDANGGSGSKDPVLVDENSKYTLPANPFTAPEGMKFKCWKVESTEYNVGDQITVTKNITVLAMWKENQDSGEDYGYNYFNNYYGELTWLNSEDLKTKLYTIIHNGYSALPYAGSNKNWETNQYADQDLYNHDCVDVVYSDEPVLKTLTYYSGNGGWQREHAFAASLMTGKITSDAVETLGRATDFHNLFAANYSGNTSRGNKNFGVADTSAESYQNRGNYSFDSKNFEPSNYDKGRLARAIFYMGVMYSQSELSTYQALNIVEDYVTYTEGSCQYAIGNLSTLLNWNETYTVDYLEYQHNQSVYDHIFSATSAKQGNRNPFVDYPELVDYVFGSKKDESGDLAKLKPSDVILDVEEDGVMHYAIKDVKTKFKVGEKFNSSAYTLLAVDHKLNETTADSSADLTEEYTFTESDAGKTKSLVIHTAINDITVNVTVEADDLDSCSYHFIDNYDDNNHNLFNRALKANESKNVTLNGEVWSFTCKNDITIARDRLGIKFGGGAGSAAGVPEEITMISQSSFTNVNKVYLKLNTASGQTYSVQILVGSTSVKTFSITRNTESKLYLTDLSSNLSGQVTIKFTSVSAALYFAGIGINVVS